MISSCEKPAADYGRIFSKKRLVSMLQAGIAVYGPNGPRGRNPHTFVETDRLLLVGACFEAQERLVSPTSFVLDSVQKSFPNSPTACRWPGIHTLDLGVTVEHRDAAAAHREAVQPRQEEADIRLE
jgi:hypothetical protein